jgi:hypothetical protein
MTLQRIAAIVFHKVMHELSRAEFALGNLEAASTFNDELLLCISSASGIVESCIMTIACNENKTEGFHSRA